MPPTGSRRHFERSLAGLLLILITSAAYAMPIQPSYTLTDLGGNLTRSTDAERRRHSHRCQRPDCVPIRTVTRGNATARIAMGQFARPATRTTGIRQWHPQIGAVPSMPSSIPTGW